MFETIKDNISQNNPHPEAQIWLILMPCIFTKSSRFSDLSTDPGLCSESSNIKRDVCWCREFVEQ